MKFKINTSEMKKLLAKVQAGMGNGKVLPITDYIEILVEDETLYMTSTTLNTYVTVDTEVEQSTEGAAVVKGAQLIKLVNKTTRKSMEFNVIDEEMHIKGNGQYSLPILQEEFPSYEFGTADEEITLPVGEFQNIFEINKSSIAQEMLMPCLTGYNMGETCITTNSVKMCINETPVFDNRVLIPQEVAALTKLLSGDNVLVQVSGGSILIEGDNTTIFGSVLEGIDDYPDITGILGLEFDGKIELKTEAVISVLERLDIFADFLNVNGVVIRFEDTALRFTDLQGKNEETMGYDDPADLLVGEEIKLNLKYLIDILKAVDTDTFELHYGNENLIKIISGSVKHFLSVLDE